MVIRRKQQSKKKIRTRKKNRRLQKRFHHHEKVFVGVGIFSAIVAFLVLMLVIARHTIFSSTYRIQQVTFSPESIEQFDDPVIYSDLTERILGKNYYLLKRNHLKDIRTYMYETYPLIEDIIIEQSGEQRVYVTIAFHEPTVVFRSPSGYTAVYDNNLYPLVSGNTLGNNTLTIDIPRYTSGYDSLHGILYPMGEKKLKEYIVTILETLGERHISEIIYLPGGMKLFITYKGKRVYFHLDQEVNRQLTKLVDLENRYADFDTIWVIDVGSIDDVIVR